MVTLCHLLKLYTPDISLSAIAKNEAMFLTSQGKAVSLTLIVDLYNLTDPNIVIQFCQNSK